MSNPENHDQNTSPGAPAPGDGPAVGISSPAGGETENGGRPEDRAGIAGGVRAGESQDAFEHGAESVEGDLDELVKTAAQRDEYLALAQRTQADFENYRKRVAREAASAHERGAATLAKELLPALDNLDRAIEAAAPGDPLLHGVRLVRDEIAAALARAGIESYSPAGEAFDPALHEAVATAPQPEGSSVASGTVVEVYQPGYRLKESVIRPARVVVAA